MIAKYELRTFFIAATLELKREIFHREDRGGDSLERPALYAVSTWGAVGNFRISIWARFDSWVRG